MGSKLVKRFSSLACDLGAPADIVQRWSAEFVARYTEPQRHYHTLSHISSMFECLEEHQSLIQNSQTLSLAIFFHDWIYVPTKGDNEVQSIQAFERFANSAGLQQPLQEQVNTYIERTITHTLPSVKDQTEVDSDLLLFLDADLEVLSRSFNEYDRYAQQIREEYRHYPDDDYRRGRAKVLKGFLEREQIYFSSAFAGCESAARSNLKQEIAMLEAA